MGAAKFVRAPQIVELRVTLGRTASMPSPDAAARHTGAGVARRQAHHERMRDERAREAAAGDAELPPEDDAVEMASAVHVLDSVAEVGPNYTLLRSKETKAMRRKHTHRFVGESTYEVAYARKKKHLARCHTPEGISFSQKVISRKFPPEALRFLFS